MKCPAFLLLYLSFSAIYSQSLPQPVAVPFHMVGNTIFVEAILDGQPGNYIFDTGAPKTFLNSAYFEGIKIPWNDDVVMDINGNVTDILYYIVQDLTLSGFPLLNDDALVMDLTSLEKAKGIAINGILGYPVLKELEILLDFEKQELLLFPLDQNGYRLCPASGYTQIDSFEMKMSKHIPCIMVQSGDRELRLGIDTGAEVNLINERAVRKNQLQFEVKSSVVLRGTRSKSKICSSGKISGLNLGSIAMEDTEIVLTNLDLLNEHLGYGLDGMLGAPFLKQGKMAINYKQKKFYLWEEAGNTLAEKTRPILKEAVTSGLK